MPARPTHDSRSIAWIVIIICLLPHLLSASVTLPLNGYCKPGRYFPILVDGEDASNPVAFNSAGCIPTDVQPSQQTHYVVPMLTIGTPTKVKWPTGSARLLTPRDNERLIACTAVTPEISSIFPHNTTIPILLNPADPLPGPAAAWESLDAIVLDADLMARISDSQRSALLAGGVTLAAVGKIPPDNRWPWQQHDGFWILSFPITGPMQAIDENAYLPTIGWTPGWPASIRWQVFGAGLLVTLVTLTLSSWHHRFVRISIPIFILCFAAAICLWRRALDPIDQIGGDILVKDGKLIQQDHWVYQRAKSDCVTHVPWRGLTHPIFASPSAIKNSAMRLNVSAKGDLNFAYEMAANHTLSFVRREVKVDEIPTSRPIAQSPMRQLAKEKYLAENNDIVGESGDSSERWPSVIIQRRR